MQFNEKDLAYLLDMYKFCLEIVSFTKGMRYYHFENDNKTIRAVERDLEIIGEASNRISEETKKAYPNIPWDDIRGLRNRLAHDYGNILIFRLWEIYDKETKVRVRDYKEKSDCLNIQENEIWNMVGRISMENLFSDIKEINKNNI